MHNVDDILNNTVPKEPVKVEVINNEEKSLLQEDVHVDSKVSEDREEVHEQGEAENQELSYLEKFQKDKKEYLDSKNDNSEKTTEEPEENVQKKPEKQENIEDTDEYGNKIAKKQKLYTEEEVNQRIRERLSRGKYAQEQPIQQQVQQATQDFKADPASDESWETQLESFVVNTVEKLTHKKQKEQWQELERHVQEEFQDKFTNGMSRYDDFSDVVGSKPITNSMMMATRNMQDPAAFIYAASKQQPKELERIASINNPYQQAAEMGRLEERMRKARKTSTAPKPSTKVKSDVNASYNDKPSIDNRILSDAKRKLSRR